MKYSTHGNCSAVCISEEYILPFPESDYCVLASSTTIIQPLPEEKNPTVKETYYGVDLLNQDVGANFSYPSRLTTHSSYDPVQK